MVRGMARGLIALGASRAGANRVTGLKWSGPIIGGENGQCYRAGGTRACSPKQRIENVQKPRTSCMIFTMKWQRRLWYHFCCHGDWCKLNSNSQPQIAQNLIDFGPWFFVCYGLVENLLTYLVLTGHIACTQAEAPVLFCLVTYMCKSGAKTTPNHFDFFGWSQLHSSQKTCR